MHRNLMPAVALAVLFALYSTASNAQSRIGSATSVQPDASGSVGGTLAAGSGVHARVDDDWFTGRDEIDAALHPAQRRVHELRRIADRARNEGRFDDARRDYVAAVDICRRSANPALLAHTLRHLGDIER